MRRVRLRRRCVAGSSAAAAETLSDDDCVIVDVQQTSHDTRKTHVVAHELDDDDQDVLMLGEWLSDIHINLAQALLKLQFPQCGGLENCGLGGTGKKQFFSPARDDFVQLFNTSGNHWITLTNIGCRRGQVKVYDSLYRTIRADTRAALLRILSRQLPRRASGGGGAGKDVITVIMPSIQKQPNYSDCGVFAIAVATTLLIGKDPSKMMYRTKAMRAHLKDCFDRRQMTHFPYRALGLTDKLLTCTKTQLRLPRQK